MKLFLRQDKPHPQRRGRADQRLYEASSKNADEARFTILGPKATRANAPAWPTEIVGHRRPLHNHRQIVDVMPGVKLTVSEERSTNRYEGKRMARGSQECGRLSGRG